MRDTVPLHSCCKAIARLRSMHEMYQLSPRNDAIRDGYCRRMRLVRNDGNSLIMACDGYVSGVSTPHQIASACGS